MILKRYVSETDDFYTVTSLVKLEDKQTDAFIKTFQRQPQTLVIDRKQMNETFFKS